MGNSRQGLLLKKAVLLAAAVSLSLVIGCKSKPKAEESTDSTATTTTNPTPEIDSTPMSFDAQGSDSGKINGLQTINFDYDKSALSADAKKKVQGNVDWLKTKNNVNIQIEGHCDNRGSIEYNLSLGERRAQAVKAYMVSLGINGSKISIISYGKEKPLSNDDSDAAQSKNRRANFVPISQ